MVGLGSRAMLFTLRQLGRKGTERRMEEQRKNEGGIQGEGERKGRSRVKKQVFQLSF